MGCCHVYCVYKQTKDGHRTMPAEKLKVPKFNEMNILDEEEKRKLVLFYIVYTCIYFPILFLLLLWTKGILVVGQYCFQSYLLMITVAETAKYFASALHLQRKDYNLSKKPEKSIYSQAWRLLFSGAKLKEGAKTLIVVSLSILLYFLIAVLFGAEVFSKHEETFMFSSLLSVLTIFPVCLNLGHQSVLPLLVGIKPTNVMEKLISQNMYLTLAGAWIGAIAIPLDWDRPWQKWPITCCLGAMFGFLASHICMMYRIRSRSPKKQK